MLVTRATPASTSAREPIQWADVALPAAGPRARFEAAARTVVSRPGAHVQVFPDSALLRVSVRTGDDLVYTVIRNRSHLNIDFMFLETQELVPGEDTLHVVEGIATSRPNRFLTVSEDDIAGFFTAWRALRPGDGSWGAFLSAYAVRRSDPRFWAASDFFNARFPMIDPLDAGILDLSRYIDD